MHWPRSILPYGRSKAKPRRSDEVADLTGRFTDTGVAMARGAARAGAQSRRPLLRIPGFACVTIAMLVLAACRSGGGDPKVKLAEKHVSDAQQALSDARSSLATKTDEFCRSSAAA